MKKGSAKHFNLLRDSDSKDMGRPALALAVSPYYTLGSRKNERTGERYLCVWNNLTHEFMQMNEKQTGKAMEKFWKENF